MAAFVLGLDIGTTGTKAVLVEPGTGVLAQASRPAALYSDHPGWAEADPGQWWENVKILIPQVLGGAGVAAREVAAVAVTGMVPAVIPVGADNRPLRRAILQNDARAALEVGDLARRLAEAGFDPVAETGSALTQQSVAPTLMWLARNEPDVWARTRRVLGSYDWVARALGAREHVERNWALESGLYPLHGGEPIRVVTKAAGIAESRLPPVAEPGSVIGVVSPDARSQTGLHPGTLIVAGGADHVLSAYAAGLADPGDWLVKLGGAGDILVVTKDVFLDPRLYLDAHPQPGTWLPNGCMATSGSLIRWFQSMTGGADVEQLEAQAAAAGPAELIALPYFLGEKSPLHDPDLRGAFLGLHLAHTRGDLYRAILEAIAYGFRHHTEIFAERGIVLADAAKVSNGGSRSPIWKQILADALGRPLVPVLDHPGASLGAALVAAVGAGLLEDWSDVHSLVTTGEPITPDPRTADRYTEAYQIYREAAQSLAPISHRLARRRPIR